MIPTLAYAQGADTSNSSLSLVLIATLIIAAACIIAAIPVVTARRRRLGNFEAIAAAAVLWALLSAGIAIYAASASMHWSQEYDRNVASGYFDPNDQSGRPDNHWILWGSLVAVYGAILLWTLVARPYVAPPPTGAFPVIPPAADDGKIET